MALRDYADQPNYLAKNHKIYRQEPSVVDEVFSREYDTTTPPAMGLALTTNGFAHNRHQRSLLLKQSHLHDKPLSYESQQTMLHYFMSNYKIRKRK